MSTPTKHTDRPELSFDGCGINGPDEFRSRIATFEREHITKGQLNRYGPLFAAAPEMADRIATLESQNAELREALKSASWLVMKYRPMGSEDEVNPVLSKVSAALARATGKAQP